MADSDLKAFLKNQTFPRFSPCEIGWRKARVSLIRADSSHSNIVFPLKYFDINAIYAK